MWVLSVWSDEWLVYDSVLMFSPLAFSSLSLSLSITRSTRKKNQWRGVLWAACASTRWTCILTAANESKSTSGLCVAAVAVVSIGFPIGFRLCQQSPWPIISATFFLCRHRSCPPWFTLRYRRNSSMIRWQILSKGEINVCTNMLVSEKHQRVRSQNVVLNTFCDIKKR